MSVIRTEDQVLAQLQDALVAWSQGSSAAARQAAGAVGRLRELAERTRQQHAQRLTAAIAAERDAGRLSLATRAATDAQTNHLASIIEHYDDLMTRLEAARRRLDGPTASAVFAARADLSRRRRHLEQYRAGGGGQGITGAVAVPSPGAAASSPDESLVARGLEEVPLDEISFADNPLVGDFGRGGNTLTDYRWALETWETTVRSGIAAGMTRDDFAQRDAQRSAVPLRRTADVYDMFLGDTDRIRLSLRPGGGYEVTNGRHRIQAARDLGLYSLPASVSR